MTDSISLRLIRLPSKHIALFSACVAERLVGFYDAFARKHGLADKLLVRDVLDAVWQYLMNGCSAQDLRQHLARLEEATPASEAYDSLESILAQNLCIVVDSAIRSSLGDQGGDSVSGEFGIELLRAAVSHAKTGFIDVGSGSGAQTFEIELVSDPIIASEIEFERSDLDSLESNSCIWNKLVIELKGRAERHRLSVTSVLGTSRGGEVKDG